MRIARRYLVSGRVQGVGYRYFVQRAANAAGLRGWVRNLDDGRVEVLAMGTASQLDAFLAELHRGPRWADVHEVQQAEAAPESRTGFDIV